MRYELFGTNLQGEVEFLGSFNNKNHMLDAFDEYMGIGYKKIKYCLWSY